MIAGMVMSTGFAGVKTLPAQQVSSAQLLTTETSSVLLRPVSITLTHVPLKAAIKAMAANASVRIIFQEQLLDAVTAPVSLHAAQMPLGDALGYVLQGTGLRASLLTSEVVNIGPAQQSEGTREGDVTGVVRDAKTKQPLSGVVVQLDRAKGGVTTDDRGAFRFPNVSAGTHVLHARRVSYVKRTQEITVSDGANATVTITLEPSINTLDQVVVTGTVIPTERRAIPNEITVITGEQLEQRGITRIDQLFRGDVPGLYVNRLGQMAATSPGAIAATSRGSTDFGSPNPTDFSSDFRDHIKTYVDGVEMANSSYIGLIDPTNIERIEILSGPEASTIYGSGAMNGVIQIFTKRGKTTRPQLTLHLNTSWQQNSLSSAVAPTQIADGSANGVEGYISYNVGGSWQYQGSWVPAVAQQTSSEFGGVRATTGRVISDGSMRLMQSRNKSNGVTGAVWWNLLSNGVLSYYPIIPDRNQATSTNQSLGLTETYQMTSWWAHMLTLGRDQLQAEGQTSRIRYGGPSDTSLRLSRQTQTNTNVTYSSTINVHSSSVTASASIGVDASRAVSDYLCCNYIRRGASGLVSTDYNGWYVTHGHSSEHGGYLTTQLGLWDALFFQYGLRAVNNPNIGADQNPNWEPRYGISYVLERGTLTAKLRASYGTATQPPGYGRKDLRRFGPDEGASFYQSVWGTDIAQLGNPDLQPENQHGGEGGVELYIGNRASFQITRYNQVVDNLIAYTFVDSLDAFLHDSTLAKTYGCMQAWACRYYLPEYINVGSVRNQGWEFTTAIPFGPFTATGTYTVAKSRVIGVTAQYRKFFRYFVPGSSFYGMPEHRYGFGLAFSHAGTRFEAHVQGQGKTLITFNQAIELLDRRLTSLSPRANPYTLPQIPTDYATYALGDFDLSQRLTSRIEGLIHMTNVGNSFQSELDPRQAQPGRSTGIGLRVRF